MKKLLSFIPFIALIALIYICVSVFSTDALEGATQVSLLIASAICVFIGYLMHRVDWAALEQEMTDKIASCMPSIIILLLIGAIGGTWMVSGIVPTMIYYGVQVLRPEWFLVSSSLFCALVSLMVGSSWTTVATIGVALMGIGRALGIEDGWVAGSIITGAYFGDKLSPLSDTTVLASSVSGTPLFTHIRYMTITTVPAVVIALVVYGVAGLFVASHSAIDTSAFTLALQGKYNLSPWLLVVPVATGLMIARKLPAIIVLFASSVLAGLFAIFFQPHILAEVIGAHDTSVLTLFKGVMLSGYGATAVHTGNSACDALLATRGMQGMMGTVWLILCAICFGGVLKASGMLANIMHLLLPLTRTRFGLVASTVVSGIFFNTTVADQYLSIMLSASMYKSIYEREGFEPRLLSRSIEDSSTVTSVLVPWSTCGMTQSSVLNVPTLTYLPYTVFCYLCPLMSMTIAALGFKIYRNVSNMTK